MARGNTPAQGERATPYRRTHLRLDTPQTLMVESPFGRSYVLDQMASGPDAVADGVHFLEQVGWELKPLQLEESNVRERSDAQGGLIQPVANGGELEVGAGFTQRAMFRSPTDLSGATTGSSGQLVAQGDYFVERTVAANQTWVDQKMTADQDAYIGPSSEENIAVDRVAALQTTLSNDQALLIRFHVPGNGRQQPRIVGRFMFPGPAGYHKTRVLTSPADSGATATEKERARTGIGHYCITFYGDGRAALQERCVRSIPGGSAATIWTKPVYFRYAPSTQVTGRQHSIYIRPTRRLAVAGAWMIVFRCENTTAPAANVGAALSLFKATPGDQQVFVYRVPYGSSQSTPAPVRVDNRRDHRPKFQINKARYASSGTLRCDSFVIPFWPTATRPLRIIWSADVPTGTTLTVRAYDGATGVELTSTGSGSRYKDFSIAFGQSLFYVVFTFTSTGERTPTLYGYRAQRNGRLVTTTGSDLDMVARTADEGLVQRTFSGVEIMAAEGEPHQESGSVTVFDLTNQVTELQARGEVPIILETEYDSADPAVRSILLEGYSVRPRRTRRGRGTQQPASDYPSGEWAEIRLQLVGMWKRIAEQYSNQRFNWHWPDPTHPTGAPYKATDAIYEMLNWCGFSSAQLDIPDLPIRLFPADNEADLFVEPGAPIMEYVLKIARDYLGAALVYDPNAGAAGMVRLIVPKRPPYSRLARFAMAPDAALGSDVRLAHNLDAYGTFDDNGTDIPNVYVTGHERQLIPPEANAVLVSGVALGDWSNYQRLTQWAVNPLSFDFYDGAATADPTHIDYLGRIVPLMVIDPGLNTAAAVNWATRRYYDQTCRGYMQDTVAGPLVLVDDPNDAEQRVKRKMRWYDPVAVGWEADATWLVRNCTISYVSDYVQQATYELQQPVGPYAD